jgi:hypothetical protein
MKETDKKIQELFLDNKETDRQMKETDRQMKDMLKTLKNLGLNVDGINKTTGLEVEEFFYSSFDKEKRLNNIKFDSIISNLRAKKDGRKHEIDIFLENGNSVGIIEVKNQVKEKDLEQLQKIVDNFYYFHPSFKDYKIIPAIAGKIFPEHLKNKALKNGFVVVTQVGNHIEQQNPDKYR